MVLLYVESHSVRIALDEGWSAYIFISGNNSHFANQFCKA